MMHKVNVSGSLFPASLKKKGKKDNLIAGYLVGGRGRLMALTQILIEK